MAAYVEDVLRAARSKLGVTEFPYGSNRVEFNDWAGVVPGPWCAAFASWCLSQGNALDVAKFVYCPTGVQEYKNANRWGTAPRLGAAIFFQWPGQNRACHIGLVEGVRSDGAVLTIEGNTDVAGGGSGGKVMRQVRRAYILGYGYPQYTALQKVMPVKLDFDPPIPNMVSWLNAPGGGGWGMGTDGGIFSLGGAPFHGTVVGKDYFKGRVAAHLEGTPDGRYKIVATSGESYGPDF